MSITLAVPILVRSGSGTTSVDSFTFSQSVSSLSGLSGLTVSLASGSGEARTVNVSAPANQSGSGQVTLKFTHPTDSALFDQETFTVNVRSVNDAPTITSISDQSINENQSTAALAFTIADVESTAANFAVGSTNRKS